MLREWDTLASKGRGGDSKKGRTGEEGGTTSCDRPKKAETVGRLITGSGTACALYCSVKGRRTDGTPWQERGVAATAGSRDDRRRAEFGPNNWKEWDALILVLGRLVQELYCYVVWKGFGSRTNGTDRASHEVGRPNLPCRYLDNDAAQIHKSYTTRIGKGRAKGC